jgi:hypothetical protein
MVQQTLSLLDFLACASPQTSQASKQARVPEAKGRKINVRT